MGLLSKAAMVIWNDITPHAIAEHDDWHSHEHMPERLSIPGFLRGRRCVALSGSPRYFILYEVEDFDTLISRPYLERLNHPTPWSREMMTHFRNMTRSLCRIQASFGSGMGQTLLTIRLSPVAGQEEALRAWLTESLLPGLPARRGLVGAHLLQAEKQVGLPQTKEQEIRGGDATADWVLLAEGYDAEAVIHIMQDEFREETLVRQGASPEQVRGVYGLTFAICSGDPGVSP